MHPVRSVPILRQLTRLCNPPRQATTFLAGRLHPARSITSTPASQAKARAVPHRNSFAQVRFTAADVPALSFWTAHVHPPLVQNKEVSPTECLEACQQYASLAIEDNPGWRQRAITISSSPTAKEGEAISIYTLHYVAIMLMQSPGQGGHIATHILNTGVTLGYAPSILTFARLGLKANKLDAPHFQGVREALEKLANPSATSNRSSGNSEDTSIYRPDALTLLGLHQAPQNPDKALQLFTSASKAFTTPSASTPTEWQWRATALLSQARILLRRRQSRQALAILRAGARETDNADLCYLYASLLDDDDDDDKDPERLAMLERAAVSGVEDAAREMARVERARSAEEGLGAWERRLSAVLADEWAAVAGDKAII
ncbi:hypothetical protein M426DRAFT_317123 [Hypoxylon sp. CI-4A]|nr:hypothetical protein M426DRAFT_317123 [Hypoxylon sp. CI-4A]